MPSNPCLFPNCCHWPAGTNPSPRAAPGGVQGAFIDEDEVAAAVMDPALYELPNVDDLEVAAAAAAAALEVLHGGARGAGDSSDDDQDSSDDESSSEEDSDDDSSEESDSDSDESSEASSSDDAEDARMADAVQSPAGPASSSGAPLLAVRLVAHEASSSVALSLSVRPSAAGRGPKKAAGAVPDVAMREAESDSSPLSSDTSDDEESDVSVVHACHM